MELSVIYLLLTLIETTCNPFCEASNWQKPKLAKWYRPSAVTEGYTESKDGTLYLNIEEDSNTVFDLARKVLSILNLTDDISVQGTSLTQLDSSLGRSRRAPGIFGKDTRVNMRASLEAQMYPFSTAVMLSSGCTGTLIGAQHVLTAAHCVRNGKKLLKSAKKLKVGLLQRSGKFHWISVKRTYVPKDWKAQTPPRDRLRYDFAVLKLKRQHNRQHMSVQTSSLLPGSKIQFSGFHGDKWYNSLWYTYCRVYRKSNDMILNFCDGAKGVSGSGVYVDTPSGDENAVVGVVSAIARGKVKGKVLEFNVINSLTTTKVRQISKWVTRR